MTNVLEMFNFAFVFVLLIFIFKYFQTDIEQWLFKITRVFVRYHKKRLTHKIRDLDPFESICLLLDNIKHFNKGVALCSYYYHEIVLYTGTCIRLTRNNGYFKKTFFVESILNKKIKIRTNFEISYHSFVIFFFFYS